MKAASSTGLWTKRVRLLIVRSFVLSFFRWTYDLHASDAGLVRHSLSLRVSDAGLVRHSLSLRASDAGLVRHSLSLRVSDASLVRHSLSFRVSDARLADHSLDLHASDAGLAHQRRCHSLWDLPARNARQIVAGADICAPTSARQRTFAASRGRVPLDFIAAEPPLGVRPVSLPLTPLTRWAACLDMGTYWFDVSPVRQYSKVPVPAA